MSGSKNLRSLSSNVVGDMSVFISCLLTRDKLKLQFGNAHAHAQMPSWLIPDGICLNIVSTTGINLRLKFSTANYRPNQNRKYFHHNYYLVESNMFLFDFPIRTLFPVYIFFWKYKLALHLKWRNTESSQRTPVDT